MKKFLTIATMLATLTTAGLVASTMPAQARTHFNIGIGIGLPGIYGGGYGHRGYYDGGYYGGYPGYYAPVVYAPPPAYAYPVYQYAQPVRYYRPAPRPYPVGYGPGVTYYYVQ